jgi:arylsulfatase
MFRRFLLALAALLAACGRAPDARPPSILFVSLDTLAAGHTSLHGYARRTTPNLAALAAEAVVFERCLANAPWTSPSYASQFTGLLPESSWSAPDPERTRPEAPDEPWRRWNVPAARVTLAETLLAAGYRTAAFIDNPMCGAVFGFEQGFERFDTSAAEIPAQDPEGGLRAQLPLVLDWLAAQRGAPAFAFVNALDVHEPYLPAARVARQFEGDELARSPEEQPIGRDGRFAVVPERQARTLLGPGELPARMRTAPLVERYDAEILDLDAVLGELVAGLRERGLLDELVLVITADHGETMGAPEHKFGHGTQVEAVLHVPLVVRLPGGAHGGTRVRAPVQLVDLYPTLAELAGARVPAGLHGRSLVGALAGAALASDPIVHQGGRLQSRAVSDGEWRLVITQPGYDINGLVSSARGRAWFAAHQPELLPMLDAGLSLPEMLARRSDLKQIVNRAHAELRGPFFELYHLPSDPHQLVDRAAAEPALVARLRAVFEQAEHRAAEERVRVPVKATELAPADAEELRALGYAGDER